MKTAIATFFLLSFSLFANAQEKALNNLEDAKLLSQKVAGLFEKTQIKEAFTELRVYWPLPENELDGLEEKTIKNLNVIESRYGKMEGVAKVNESSIKDFAFQETYIVKCKYHALRLIFTYYRNSTGWLINGFKWDDSFAEEFK